MSEFGSIKNAGVPPDSAENLKNESLAQFGVATGKVTKQDGGQKQDLASSNLKGNGAGDGAGPGNPGAPVTGGDGKKPPNKSRCIGHYMIGKNIGEGTFGKVKAGTHNITGEKVSHPVLERKSMGPILH